MARRGGARSDGLFSASDIGRFWSAVRRGQEGECWPWTKGVDKDGYGRFTIKPNGKQRHLRAARVALYLHTGVWGEIAMHTCDSPPCCNPAHLRWGTQLENRRDAKAKGRTASIQRLGHDWAGANRPTGEAHGNAKLSAQAVAEIRRDYKAKINGKELAQRYGVGLRTLVAVARGRERKAG